MLSAWLDDEFKKLARKIWKLTKNIKLKNMNSARIWSENVQSIKDLQQATHWFLKGLKEIVKMLPISPGVLLFILYYDIYI